MAKGFGCRIKDFSCTAKGLGCMNISLDFNFCAEVLR
jgi:hypothetical protein